MPEQLLTRHMQVRAVDTEAREFDGIAVPWDTPAEIHDWDGDYVETFARGSVVDSDDALVVYRHDEPIGRLVRAEDADAGWDVSGRLSATRDADDAYALLRDGVIAALSVGFEPIEEVRTVDDDGTVHVNRTKVKVREVSLVPFPAYDAARITAVRSANPPAPPQEDDMPETLTRADLDPLAQQLDEVRRNLALVRANQPPLPPATRFRTAGHLLKAIVAGDEEAIREYNDTLQRAWSGAVVADSTPVNTWVGDLTRLIDEAAVLASLFASDSLPESGMTLEYGVLDDNTIDVDEQAAEGDNLTFGNVSTEPATTTVRTYGGYTSLSRKAIERGNVNLLNHSLNAMAIAAGKRRNTVWRSVFAAAVAAQVTALNTVTVADGDGWTDWLGAVVDAAEKYTDLGLGIDALVVDKTIFKRMAQMAGTDGRPIMTVFGTGTNVVGSLDVKAIQGEFASVPVRLNPKQAAPGAAFINSLAIREYKTPIAQLQDENIVNLTKDFSVYFYGAHAVEIPSAIIPVTITA
jgi:HK97 family phage prohead protease